MRTLSRHKTGLIATIVLVGTIGLWMLVYITCRPQHCCEQQSFIDNVSLIKLI